MSSSGCNLLSGLTCSPPSRTVAAIFAQTKEYFQISTSKVNQLTNAMNILIIVFGVRFPLFILIFLSAFARPSDALKLTPYPLPPRSSAVLRPLPDPTPGGQVLLLARIARVLHRCLASCSSYSEARKGLPPARARTHLPRLRNTPCGHDRAKMGGDLLQREGADDGDGDLQHG